MDLPDPHTAQVIRELKSAYFACLDSKQWSRMKGLFTSDAEFDGYAFDAHGASGFVAAVSGFLDGVHTQHAGYNPRLRLRDDGSVRGVWAMHDYLTWPPGTRGYKGADAPGMYGIRGWGRYEDLYVDVGSGMWRIAYSRLVRSRVDALVGSPPVTIGDLGSGDCDWLSE